MQTLAFIFEGALAVLAIALAVGAPIVGMRLHRREARLAARVPALAGAESRDDLPVAA